MSRPRGSFQRAPEPKRFSLRRPLGGPSRAHRRDGWSSLARLLRSGVGVSESLRMLAGSGARALDEAFTQSAEALEDGATLTEALGRQDGLLSLEEEHMLSAAERVGDLAPVLEEMAQQLQLKIELRRDLIRRAVYPMLLLVSTALIGPLPLFVTGGPAAYFASVGKSILVIGLLGPGLCMALFLALRNATISDALRRVAWTMPLGAGAYCDRVRARFSRVLGRNLESGLPVYASLESAARVTADPKVIEGTKAVASSLSMGADLASSLASMGLYEPGDRMQLVSAERSGDLDRIFRLLAAHYDARSQTRLRRLSRIFSGILTSVAVLYVASGIIGSYRDAVLGPLEMLEQEMPHLQR